MLRKALIKKKIKHKIFISLNYLLTLETVLHLVILYKLSNPKALSNNDSHIISITYTSIYTFDFSKKSHNFSSTKYKTFCYHPKIYSFGILISACHFRILNKYNFLHKLLTRRVNFYVFFKG